MALCFAHSAAGYLVYEAARPAGPHRFGLLAASVLLANAPDLDFVPGLVLGHPGMFHRGPTHTIVAALAVGAAVALGAWVLRRRPLAAGAWAAAAYGSHLLVDCITVDAVPPYGLRLFWPFADAYFLAPVTPLREIIIDGSSRTGFFASLLRPANFPVWLADASVLVLAILGVRLFRARHARTVPLPAQPARPPEACSS